VVEDLPSTWKNLGSKPSTAGEGVGIVMGSERERNLKIMVYLLKSKLFVIDISSLFLVGSI
jgi:hypothetical protein